VRATDCGDVRRLTTDPDHERPADYSHDGKEIYFFRPNAAFAIPDQRQDSATSAKPGQGDRETPRSPKLVGPPAADIGRPADEIPR